MLRDVEGRCRRAQHLSGEDARASRAVVPPEATRTLHDDERCHDSGRLRLVTPVVGERDCRVLAEMRATGEPRSDARPSQRRNHFSRDARLRKDDATMSMLVRKTTVSALVITTVLVGCSWDGEPRIPLFVMEAATTETAA